MKIPLKATIRRANEAYVITIPIQYIKNGLLYEGQKTISLEVEDK